MGSVSDYIKVIVYKSKPRMYKCTICGREYYSVGGARIHVKRKHLAKTSKA